MLGPLAAGTRDRLGGTVNAPATVTIALGGNLLQLKGPPGAVAQIGGGKRGRIVSYSRASRRRLLEWFNSLDQEHVEHTPLFITLTYPQEYPSDIKETKAHLFAFIKCALRRFPNAAVVWRLEWQKRGAPHYHLLLFNCPFWHHADVARAWHRVTNSPDAKHLEAGTRIERIRTWNGVIYYASKYLGKVGDVPEGLEPGRLWGVVNRKAMHRRLLVQPLAWETWYAMRRVMWRREERQARAAGRKARFVGFTVFMPAADAIRLLSATKPGRATTL